MKTEKLPAQNIEAEEAVLSSILISNKTYENCCELLPTDFYHLGHQAIFQAIVNLFNKNTPIDLVTVATELTETNRLDYVGGAAYLSRIMDSAPMAMNVGAYADAIKDCALNRRVRDTASQILDKAMAGTSGEILLEEAQSEFLKIQSTKKEDAIKRVCDLVHHHLDRIETANSTQETGGYKMGFFELDRHLTLKNGKLIVVAGRPGMGKTSFAVSIMKNMDLQGITTGILSIEMPEDEIMDKWIAMHSNVNSMKFGKYNGLQEVEMQSVLSGCQQLSKSKMMIDDSGSISIQDVERKCRKMVKAGAQVLFIDQLSHIKGDRDRFARYEINCNRIAQLKKELNVPIFLLAQLNREVEKRNSKEPQLSDLKMTGSLEEDADAVLLVYRPEKYMKPDEIESTGMKGAAVINLAKNRAGGTWRDCDIRFNEQTTYFYQGTGY